MFNLLCDFNIKYLIIPFGTICGVRCFRQNSLGSLPGCSRVAPGLLPGYVGGQMAISCETSFHIWVLTWILLPACSRVAPGLLPGLGGFTYSGVLVDSKGIPIATRSIPTRPCDPTCPEPTRPDPIHLDATRPGQTVRDTTLCIPTRPVATLSIPSRPAPNRSCRRPDPAHADPTRNSRPMCVRAGVLPLWPICSLTYTIDWCACLHVHSFSFTRVHACAFMCAHFRALLFHASPACSFAQVHACSFMCVHSFSFTQVHACSFTQVLHAPQQVAPQPPSSAFAP